MRRLLLLVPFLLSAAQAKAAVSSTMLVFQVPAGARSVVIELDGDTRVSSLLGKTGKFGLKVVLSPSGVRYAYAMKDGTGSTEVTSDTQVRLNFTPFTRKQLHFAPALNSWTSFPVGEAVSRWKITFGNGHGVRKESNHLSLNVLFTDRHAERVKGSLRPPEKP